MWADLDAAIDEAAARTGLRGLVIASAKPGIFIAGADLKLLANAPGPNDPAVRAFIERGLRVLEKLEALPFPTCAAIDGAALGGGLEVALACDYRVVSPNPKVQLGLPEVKLGLIPGWGGTQRLPRLVGLEAATTWITSGDSLAVGQAHTSGLIDWVNPTSDVAGAGVHFFNSQYRVEAEHEREFPDDPRSGWWYIPRRRKQNPAEVSSDSPTLPPTVSLAAREAVRVMVEGAALPLADAIKLETDAFMRLAGSAESKQLIAAFFASRKK
jgi:enoyl-CoA hydratase/carnithine racemase